MKNNKYTIILLIMGSILLNAQNIFSAENSETHQLSSHRSSLSSVPQVVAESIQGRVRWQPKTRSAAPQFTTSPHNLLEDSKEEKEEAINVDAIRAHRDLSRHRVRIHMDALAAEQARFDSEREAARARFELERTNRPLGTKIREKIIESIPTLEGLGNIAVGAVFILTIIGMTRF